MKNFTAAQQADRPSAFQCSGLTRRLCALLSDWPRQTIATWLANSTSPDALLRSCGRPDDGFRRKAPLTPFIQHKALPSDLKDVDFFAIGLFDSTYPDLLKHIPDPPWFCFALVMWRCWSNAVLPWLVPVKARVLVARWPKVWPLGWWCAAVLW